MKRVFVFVSLLLMPSGLLAQDNIDISAARLSENVKTLSSDYFEGRGPSTNGEVKTINFLKEKLEGIGIKPGNGDSYFQGVELVRIKAEATNAKISNLSGNGILVNGSDFAVTTKLIDKNIKLSNSEIVFVGYGAVAPEYNWNDYEDLDVKGKTVLILDQDPGFLTDDESFFKGRGVTYYARSSYKYEEAARQGAAAAFIIHDTDFTSTGWDRMAGFTMRSALSLDPDKVPANNLKMQGRIPARTLVKLFGAADLNYEAAKKNALKQGFEGISLGTELSLSLETEIIKSTSQNVIGIIPGTKRPDEYVFYMAHWDHLGTDTSLEGDQIYNGARDNASGTAGILEIAQAHMTAGAPERTMVFLWVTAEESGLLGSYYYALNPVFPLNKTVTALNIDTMNLYGRTKDVWVLGLGDSEMDEFVYDAIEGKQGRDVTFFAHPEWGIEYRGDHFSFNRMGIPSLVIAGGYDTLDKSIDMDAMINEYDKTGYHKVADEYSDSLNFEGTADDLKSMFLVGQDVANSVKFPNWVEGKEFKPLRDQHLMEIK